MGEGVVTSPLLEKKSMSQGSGYPHRTQTWSPPRLPLEKNETSPAKSNLPRGPEDVGAFPESQQ